MPVALMQAILPRVFTVYHYALKWLCFDVLVATSLRKYLQIQLMFLINDTFQEPLHAGAYHT